MVSVAVQVGSPVKALTVKLAGSAAAAVGGSSAAAPGGREGGAGGGVARRYGLGGGTGGVAGEAVDGEVGGVGGLLGGGAVVGHDRPGGAGEGDRDGGVRGGWVVRGEVLEDLEGVGVGVGDGAGAD